MKRAPLGNRRYTKRVPFLSKIVKSRVPSGYQAPVFAITGIVALPRLKTRHFLWLFSFPGTEDENPDYQGLEKRKREQSIFICPSCNANSDYQRLSRPGHCPHEGNQEREEKSRSFYESLTTERGARESVYMNPSRIDEVRIFLFSFRPFFIYFFLGKSTSGRRRNLPPDW